MPTYEYRCQQCQHELEAVQKMSEPALTHCPACSQETLSRLISCSAFQLKGKGWYVTDYKKSAESKGAENAPSSSQNAPKSTETTSASSTGAT